MGADPGASHKRRGRPGAETTTLLADAHRILRLELRDCLDELRPAPVDTGTLVLGDPLPAGRPALGERRALVELIGRLMTMLGSEIDDTPATLDEPRARARRARIDYG